jgi:hypothetical protein
MSLWDSSESAWNFGDASNSAPSVQRSMTSAQLPPQQEDTLVTFYRDKFNEAEAERKRLVRQVEFLRDQVLKAQKQHDLDYQLWLLREKDKDKEKGSPRTLTPSLCGGRLGDGYVKVATTITGSYQRQPSWSKKVVKALSSPTIPDPMEEDECDSDPEMAATLLRLLEEGKQASRDE